MVLGTYVHGGVVGITKATAKFPHLTELLTFWVAKRFPEHPFSAVVLSSSSRAERREDKYNRAGSRNLVSLVQGRVDDPRDGV